MKKHTRFTGIVKTIATASVVVYGSAAYAAIPPGYYNSANSSNAAALHASLHEIIDDHQRFPYTSSSTDTWDILELADQDPDNSNNVIDIYKNASYAKEGGGNSNYNREHSWPKSYGFPNDGSTNYAYTDTHHLFIANSSYNSSRSNKPYANCDSSCTEKVTEFNNNRGGTSTQSNWTTGSYENGTWETWSGRRGDVARALMYMAVRYEGGSHGVTGVDEPDLRLTDDRNLIGNSSTGSNISVAYMGLKSVLLQWHAEDPVDDMERLHNDTVYSFQGNRNPFVDHPEFVQCVFQNICSGGGGDTTPPATPTNLSATGGSGLVELAWTANQESDLAGYNVYRSDSLNGTYTKLNSGLINTSAYTDESVTASTTYFYKVSAVDTSSNESTLSAAQSATTDAGSGGGGSAQAWINELHYDNDGSDSNEFIEVAATAGMDLSGWSLIAYNGNGGSTYKTVALSGIVSDQSNGFGFVQFAFSGLQNGAPDGIALVNATGDVVQFLSYEGVMTANDGAASGMQSTDIGVSESSSTPVGYSLQLAGTGNSYDSFVWQAAQANTAGSVNAGQTMQGSGGNQDPVAQFNHGCNGLSCNFDASASSDPDGTIVSYDWNMGDGTLLSGAMPNHSYGADGSYTVTLTVADDLGATHQQSQQVVVNDPPVAPSGSNAQGGLQQISVSWNANSESDLAGYNLYRSDTSGGTLTKLNGTLLVDTFYTDSGLTDNTSYYYRVSAVDSSGNESALATEVSATTDNPGSGGDVWINELHYDNKGSDSNEFVELAGNAGTNLSGWSLVGYNGNGGSVYKTVNLSGTIANLQNGYGTISFSFSGFQNGGPDGIALVDDAGVVVQFLSYEGTMTASNGPAQGMQSEDIGVAENSSTKKGHSLQLGGSGTSYADFYWQSAANDTPGSINNNQSF
ncbi:MAG: endonuclease [Aestuariibacter sp.]